MVKVGEAEEALQLRHVPGAWMTDDLFDQSFCRHDLIETDVEADDIAVGLHQLDFLLFHVKAILGEDIEDLLDQLDHSGPGGGAQD